jgi:hypothetical protein
MNTSLSSPAFLPAANGNVAWHFLMRLAAGFGALLGLQAGHAQVLNGNYLRVGVNPSGGLIDSGFAAGIDFDSTGTGTWSGYDFIKPGTPYEFYSVGYNGNSATGGYMSGNPLQATTTNTSSGNTLSTDTVGAFGQLGLRQDIFFDKNSSVINFSVTLTNTSLVAVSNVVYARGLDPDQDVYAGGSYGTTNTIINGDLVAASAPLTGWSIGIYSNSGYAHTPSVSNTWPRTNPYNLQAARNDGNGDYSLNMAWNLGTIQAGQSATIDFQYRIGATMSEVTAIPETRSYATILGMASLGFVMIRRRCFS